MYPMMKFRTITSSLDHGNDLPHETEHDPGQYGDNHTIYDDKENEHHVIYHLAPTWGIEPPTQA
jgi:hypothetical protein